MSASTRPSLIALVGRLVVEHMARWCSSLILYAGMGFIAGGIAACEVDNDADAGSRAPAGEESTTRESPAPAEDYAVPQRSIARFVPSQHGFAFVNHFSGSPLPSKTLNRLWGGRMDYGLCGGMSFAAADYFLANQPIPQATVPPLEGSALYRTLYRRQTQSFGLALAGSLRFAAWMAMSDRAVAELTVGQVTGIIAALDRGEPVVLGLVYHSFDETLAVWHNHQVLAYRVGDRSPAGVSLLVYDPNFPGNDEVVIAVRSADGSPMAGGPKIQSLRLMPGRRARAIRGLFAMPYRYAPPSSPASPAE